MPGFLGTRRYFHTRFARPILASRDSETSARDQAAGIHALEALHRQVLPFVLRRMKDEVLDDLPPKLLHDVPCELSALQVRSPLLVCCTQRVKAPGSHVDGGVRPGSDTCTSSLADRMRVWPSSPSSFRCRACPCGRHVPSGAYPSVCTARGFGG
jgi:hypothetical protein